MIRPSAPGAERRSGRQSCGIHSASTAGRSASGASRRSRAGGGRHDRREGADVLTLVINPGGRPQVVKIGVALRLLGFDPRRASGQTVKDQPERGTER